MLNKKSIGIFLISTFFSLLLTACGTEPSNPTPTPIPTDAGTSSTNQDQNSPTNVATQTPQVIVKVEGLTTELTNFDQKTGFDSEDVIVRLNGTTADIKGEGCSMNNSVLNITKAGTYVLSGTLNGQVYISVDKAEKVRLVLNQVSISCTNGPAIHIASADKVGITLADGTNNALVDGNTYAATGEDAPNACVFSKDDLTINGTGSLTVNANYHNGIDTSNDLTIVSGTIQVNAKNHALKGNDSISIFGGTITLNAGNDGAKSDTENEAGKGFFYMNGGTLDITAGDDGIQATTSIRVDNGSLSFHVTDDKTNCDGTTQLAEGVVK